MTDCNIDCEKCEYDFYQLIDWLIRDIQQLELKTVYLRYLLSRSLPAQDGITLKQEIFSNLSGRYYEQPGYQQYVSNYCGGRDPMDCTNFHEHMMKLSRGEEIFDL